MPEKHDFQAVFDQLKSILKPFDDRLLVEVDAPGNYYLNTRYVQKNKHPLFFGAVQIKKNYVSFHLMPIYAFPDLVDGISDDLRKRKQGKACFNFTRINDETLKQLADLTRNGIERFTPEALAQLQAKQA